METVKEVNINVPKKAIVVNKYSENSSGFIYCLGVIAAIVYYFQQASGFSEYLIGFLKALVWPGFLIYHLFKSLEM